MMEAQGMVERVAEALGEQLKLEDGGYGFVSPAMDEDGEVTDRMVVDATVRLRELARAAIEAMPAWQPIETVPKGVQVLAWEPMYGWLLACYHGDRWELKSSGNFWMECPDSVEFTHWMKLPRGPSALNEQEKG